MRRYSSLAVAASLALGLSGSARLFAQDEKKVEEAAPAPVVAPAEPKPIPPEVQAKLDAARRAVAEAIVAAQDAGLVDSTIDPPPILDILITGRADDRAKLKAISKDAPEVGVSPEVFGAWFTGYGQAEGVVAEKNIRILPPSKGLKTWYDDRNRIFAALIADVRKGKTPVPPVAPAETPKAEDAPKPEEAKPADSPKPEETKPEEAKPAEAPKAEEAKPADEAKF